MNKLRLIKIYELHKQIHPIEATIIELLDGIGDEVTFGEHIYYMNDKYTYFTYNPKNNSLWLSPHIYYTFNCSYGERKVIMKYLLEKHLKLKINNVE